jgi:BirA family biotin operon repressor/biotin-[acetyl-CoA-carboxylase] ligase
VSTFDKARVDDALRDTLFHGKLHHFTTIDSTNTRALTDAHEGAATGQVYVADEQTAGRGRGGHVWHSEPDRGLYLSVLFRPALRADAALQISLAAALAAQSAVNSSCGYALDIRWPNDLVTPPGSSSARKLGGILTETASGADGTLRHAVVGIGINLNQEMFPPELATLASSVRIESGKRVSREAVLIQLLLALTSELSMLEAEVSGADKTPLLNERFQLSSTWVSGKRVLVSEDESYTGTTDGLTRAGMLRVQCDDGTLRVVRNGGVREQ